MGNTMVDQRQKPTPPCQMSGGSGKLTASGTNGVRTRKTNVGTLKGERRNVLLGRDLDRNQENENHYQQLRRFTPRRSPYIYELLIAIDIYGMQSGKKSRFCSLVGRWTYGSQVIDITNIGYLVSNITKYVDKHRQRLPSGNTHESLFVQKDGSSYSSSAAFSQYISTAFTEFSGLRLTTTNMRKACVNFLLNGNKSNKAITDSLARLMRYRPRTQRLRYYTLPENNTVHAVEHLVTEAASSIWLEIAALMFQVCTSMQDAFREKLQEEFNRFADFPLCSKQSRQGEYLESGKRQSLANTPLAQKAAGIDGTFEEITRASFNLFRAPDVTSRHTTTGSEIYVMQDFSGYEPGYAANFNTPQIRKQREHVSSERAVRRQGNPENRRITTRRRTATSNEASGSGDAQINFGASRSILVHPDRFYGYPNEDVIDWFVSFERIARANEWDTAKCGRMVSAYLRRPTGDHFEKVPEEEKADYQAVKRSLIERFSPADMRRTALEAYPVTNYSLRTLVESLSARYGFSCTVAIVKGHLDDCDLVSIGCPNAGCDETVLRRDAVEQRGLRPMELVQCDHCQKDMARRELASHISLECIGRRVECKFGCNATSLTRYSHI
eukprot:gene6332-7058_t